MEKMNKALPLDRIISLGIKNEQISSENHYENEQECLIEAVSLFPHDFPLTVS
jgi:hypothetical protein